MKRLRSPADLEDLARRIDMFERADRARLAELYGDLDARLAANLAEIEAGAQPKTAPDTTSTPIARGRFGDLEVY